MSADENVRRHVDNALYSVVDSLALPILMFFATPFLVSRLGLEKYGAWIIVNALVGTLGVANIGLGDATVKVVSRYRVTGSGSEIIQLIKTSLAAYTMVGGLVAGAM